MYCDTDAMNKLNVYLAKQGLNDIQFVDNEIIPSEEGARVYSCGRESLHQNITLHLKNVYKIGELEEVVTSKESLLVQLDGKRQISRKVLNYNLDAIISVDYRVNSHRATRFRIWVTKVLHDYIVHGYVLNRQCLTQLGQAVEVMKRVSNCLDTELVLDVVKSYSAALDLLDCYDHQTVGKPSTKARSVELTYEECRAFIDNMKFAGSSALFGTEKDGSVRSSRHSGRSISRSKARTSIRRRRRRCRTFFISSSRTTTSLMATNASPPDFSSTSSSATSSFSAKMAPSALLITRLSPSR